MNSPAFLLLASFVEGGAVMAVELVGAKMVAPYYGTSLYVWAAVLALTLGGLATGYFLGGALSARHPSPRRLFAILALGAMLVGVMPHVAPLVMEATLGMGLRSGIVIACLVFLLPPLVLFGMVSPMIIRLISSRGDRIGRAAGLVYTISTLGGILATFVAAFYAIPYLGLRLSAQLTALLLACFPLVYFMSCRRETVS
ncbi:MAG TPA: hypothetical protein ENK48_07395 [Gammaproteobacteria bacterium]|nr:hypothetical protein [Gammaproteobacteria bacterium]